MVASQHVGCFRFRLRAELRNSFTTTDNRIVVDYTFFIIGYDSFCLCCFVISQKNVDEMQHQQNLPKPPMAKFVPFPHDQHSYYRVLNGLLAIQSKNINGYHLNVTPNINASVMIKIKGVNRRKKHSEKKKQHRYGNRQPQFVLRYEQVLPLLFISRSLNLHEHKLY